MKKKRKVYERKFPVSLVKDSSFFPHLHGVERLSFKFDCSAFCKIYTGTEADVDKHFDSSKHKMKVSLGNDKKRLLTIMTDMALLIIMKDLKSLMIIKYSKSLIIMIIKTV